MYSLVELQTIFRSCKNINEIGKAMEALLWVKADGDISPNQECYIRERALGRISEI